MLKKEIIPTVRVKTFPNQKPWMDRSILAAVNGSSTTYNVGLTTSYMSTYKKTSYCIRCMVNDVKCQYREHLEFHFHQGDMDCKQSWTTKPRTTPQWSGTHDQHCGAWHQSGTEESEHHKRDRTRWNQLCWPASRCLQFHLQWVRCKVHGPHILKYPP